LVGLSRFGANRWAAANSAPPVFVPPDFLTAENVISSTFVRKKLNFFQTKKNIEKKYVYGGAATKPLTKTATINKPHRVRIGILFD